ncbi:META domain-containing protein [Paracoccus sp. p4-l81]|uniref:META domain-containing protein n=1 Tax=unclassified Paracoccus (in: a-proteobacteria) TaxID=2688777 RepID=UPI0035B93469
MTNARRPVIACLAFALAACQPQPAEQATPSTDATGSYRLVTLNNKPLAGGATLLWEADGRITGEAPCNAFFTRQTSVLPALSLEPIGLTRRACLWSGDEAAFVAALTAANVAMPDTQGLTLTAPDGTTLRFARDPA